VRHRKMVGEFFVKSKEEVDKKKKTPSGGFEKRGGFVREAKRKSLLES